jgi:hypothetical protein
MLERGVRQYFRDNLRGLPVSGWIQRRYNEGRDDQYLFLYLVGSPESLEEIENNLLNSQPAYWMWSSHGTESHDSLGNYQFFIKKNDRHAIKGPNSDPMNEYNYQPSASHSSSRSSPSLPSINSKTSGASARKPPASHSSSRSSPSLPSITSKTSGRDAEEGRK